MCPIGMRRGDQLGVFSNTNSHFPVVITLPQIRKANVQAILQTII